jgi:threonyl-tRNA synthetase
VIGDKEADAGMVSVRHRRHGDLGQMSTQDFIARIKTEIATKEQ